MVTFAATFAPTALAFATINDLLDLWMVPKVGHDLAISAATGLLFSALAISLSRAMLQPAVPHLRVVSINQLNIDRYWKASLWIAIAIGLSIACEQAVTKLSLNEDVGIPLKALTAFASVSSVLAALLILRTRSRSPSTPEQHRDGADPAALTIGITWAISLLILVSGASGYIVLANWIIQWMIWGSIVLACAHFVMLVVDRTVRYCLEVRPALKLAGSEASRGIRQASVVLSAVLRTVVILLACGALIMPFGAGFTSVLELAGKLAGGVQIGQIRVSAGSIFTGILVFLGVAALMRMLRAWLEDSYLPTTRLASDARASIVTIVGYLGTGAAGLWALAAIGVGVEKLAILASALSVGIGFGLQAITQNFVSGLILLVERPIKLGDRIKVGDLDGTVRKVSVRSTEIRLADHSSFIVPNSDLITKPVQNLSQRYARPRLELSVSVSIAGDLEKLLVLIDEVLCASDDLAPGSAPSVLLKSIEDNKAILHCGISLVPSADYAAARLRTILALRAALQEQGANLSIS
ncbi:mechanosensitive ion channel domain-containing protein [Stenotrophomonas sp. S39]|uniref:mechanosensitive ion channel family protein n=1 Tax=Stenotrophomonas sp. S39 TaxID=2767451 RepID=UPI002D811565|nr:mechanosensitive ion channel domain-containing protein [Stenotrophomonas sp. S39]